MTSQTQGHLCDDNNIRSLIPRQPNGWTPAPGELVARDHYINKCKQEISNLNHTPLRSLNLTEGEQSALKVLQSRQDIVITSADKGGAVVVWRQDLYKTEALRQLSDVVFYQEIAKATTKEETMPKTRYKGIKDGLLPDEATRLVSQEPGEPRFYLLPKIHKQNNPGRLIVSACSCPTSLISELIGRILQPLVRELLSYVKDTNHALFIIDAFHFPPQCDHKLLFTMDFTSLYTNIPRDEGLKAIQHFLPQSKFHVPESVVLR